jgi:hypothetical protein
MWPVRARDCDPAGSEGDHAQWMWRCQHEVEIRGAPPNVVSLFGGPPGAAPPSRTSGGRAIGSSPRLPSPAFVIVHRRVDYRAPLLPAIR